MDKGDEDITLLDTHNTLQISIDQTRARQLRLEVSSFLNTCFLSFKNILLPNNFLMIRNSVESQGKHKKGLGDAPN